MIEAEGVAELMGEEAGVGIAIDPDTGGGAADGGHAGELAVGVEGEGVDLADIGGEVDAGGGGGLAGLGLQERDVAAGGGDGQRVPADDVDGEGGLLVGDLAEPGVERGIGGLGLGHGEGLGGIVGEVDQDHQGFLDAEGVGQGGGGQDLEAGDARRGGRLQAQGQGGADALDADAVAGEQVEAGRDVVQRHAGAVVQGQGVVIHAAAIVAVLVQDVQGALELDGELGTGRGGRGGGRPPGLMGEGRGARQEDRCKQGEGGDGANLQGGGKTSGARAWACNHGELSCDRIRGKLPADPSFGNPAIPACALGPVALRPPITRGLPLSGRDPLGV